MSLLINLPQKDYIQGFWKLDEESGVRADESGNGNTLQDNNTVLFGAGVIGNAADFELDTSEYLSITDVAQTGLDITGEITICAWIKLETLVNMGIVSKYSATDAKRAYYLQFINDQKIYFRLSPDGGAATSAVSASLLDAGTWYHIAATLNQTTDLMQVYINGLADGDAVAYNVNIFDNTKQFMIGAMDNSLAVQDFFDGLIDEPIVWNKCLTPAEVLQVKNISKYNYGTGNFSIFLSEAYKKGKKYFKNKGLYLPNEPKGILAPEGI